jgi:hypothetical protein
MSGADVKELGEVIDDGTAALVVVGESKIEQAIDKATLKAASTGSSSAEMRRNRSSYRMGGWQRPASASA